MSKMLKFGADARAEMKKGVDILANAVKVTIGPKGRNAIIQKPYGAPLITNDGVSIAREVKIQDPYQNMGAQLVIEVADKTNTVAGDGTTTATVLTQAMVEEGMNHINNGANPILIRTGMNIAMQNSIDKINALSKAIDGKDDIARVATISSASKEIGDLIAEAMDKVGKDGVITVEDSKSMNTDLVVVEGLEFENGYISPYMVTDIEKMVSELRNPYILISEGTISNINEILAILNDIVKENAELLIIAEDLDGDALQNIVANKLRGVFTVTAVKAPGYGEKRREMLKDIAIVTGAAVASIDTGVEVSSLTLEDLGRAGKVTVSKDKTTIVGGAGNMAQLEERVKQIKVEIENSTSEVEEKSLKDRLSKLAGGVAVIKVGAVTETELKETKLRLEDAINATKAAVEDGIVPGGGTAYASIYEDIKAIKHDTKDVQLGIDIVAEALLAPITCIVNNAGYESKDIVLEVIRRGKEGIGFDAYEGKYVNMVDSGIVDPAKVTKSALMNAISVTSTLLTTEVAIAIEEE